MDIVSEAYPEYEHVFIYDNATTHLKRADGSLSARKMPKNTSKPGSNWLVEVAKRNSETGKTIHGPDGKVQKVKIPMTNGSFGGHSQPLYFPEGHAQAGLFKGMAQILLERGFVNASKIRAECPKFKCSPGITDCCCRRLLYSQPDFEHVPSLLEEAFARRGFQLIFLPKFHCELNFIEQCWGYSKRIYRLNPESSREYDLERYALESLDSVPLETMRRQVLHLSIR